MDGVDPIGGEPYDALGAHYDPWVVSVVEDVPWYRAIVRGAALDLSRPVDVLELGAGSGRITLPVARELRSVARVVGVEASAVQCERLRQVSHDREFDGHGPSAPIEVVHGDMRRLGELVPATDFDVVLAPFRALLHVAPDRDALFATIRDVLRPGGVLAFDVCHPAIADGATLLESWTERRSWNQGGATLAIFERARHDRAHQRLELDVRVERDGVVTTETTMLLHVPPYEAWRASLEAAGFDIELVVAWFDGLPFEPGDEDSVWIARTAAD